MTVIPSISKLSSDLPTHEEARALMRQYAAESLGITATEMEDSSAYSELQTFAKGQCLLREGQIMRGCYFVIRGCVREYYIVNGEDKTTAFYTELQPITSVICRGTKAKFYLECLEDTVVSYMSAEQEEALYRRFPHYESYCRQGAEKIISSYRDSLVAYMLSTPEERYQALLENRPSLLQRVPQYMLASYLGVQPESLSRLRRRLATRQKEAAI